MVSCTFLGINNSPSIELPDRNFDPMDLAHTTPTVSEHTTTPHSAGHRFSPDSNDPSSPDSNDLPSSDGNDLPSPDGFWSTRIKEYIAHTRSVLCVVALGGLFALGFIAFSGNWLSWNSIRLDYILSFMLMLVMGYLVYFLLWVKLPALRGGNE
jgi:hypothetical protein